MLSGQRYIKKSAALEIDQPQKINRSLFNHSSIKISKKISEE
jgi:hypothetical protein